MTKKMIIFLYEGYYNDDDAYVTRMISSSHSVDIDEETATLILNNKKIAEEWFRETFYKESYYRTMTLRIVIFDPAISTDHVDCSVQHIKNIIQEELDKQKKLKEEKEKKRQEKALEKLRLSEEKERQYYEELKRKYDSAVSEAFKD